MSSTSRTTTRTQKWVEFDVSEVFSAPRISSVAQELGLTPGYSLDICYVDRVSGRKWDLREKSAQSTLWSLLGIRRSRLLVVSPPCRTCSILLNLRKSTLSPQEKAEGKMLLDIGVKACSIQMRLGGFFVFEHPVGAKSWEENGLKELMAADGVYTCELDQCMYGLMSCGDQGWGPARKATRIVTNMRCATELLATRCDGEHMHVHLRQGRAKAAERYPRGLCKAILQALILEQAAIHNQLCSTSIADLGEPDLVSEDWWCANQVADNTGDMLDPIKVKAAREKELAKFKERGVYEAILREDAMALEDVKVINTRWVQVVKGDAVRCRVVAKEFAHGDPRDDLFAGTPPLFAARALVSRTASKQTSEGPEVDGARRWLLSYPPKTREANVARGSGC